MLDPMLASRILRAEWGRMVAVGMRILHDLGDAEDVAQEALLAATRRWPADGIPANPAAWLTTVTKRRALNRLRDRNRHADPDPLVGEAAAPAAQSEANLDGYGDDRLRLVVMCCHPSLSRDAQVTLTLRLVAGLTAREIADAFVVEEATIAQRIARAKARLRERSAQFELPSPANLGVRLEAVLEVIYLVFNEGYGPHSDRRRRDVLTREAVALGRQLTELVPAHPEAWGLVALMLFQASRNTARIDNEGNLISLDEQDRSQWNRDAIREAEVALAAGQNAASSAQPIGSYVLQAEIAARHARAGDWLGTDWAEIEQLYAALVELTSNPIAGLNWAIARSYSHDPADGLGILDRLAEELAGYDMFSAARADLLRRAGEADRAADLYGDLAAAAPTAQQREFYRRRADECRADVPS